MYTSWYGDRRRAAKAEKMELDKRQILDENLHRAPDLSKTKESWVRAKKMHEEQMLKARLDAEMKGQRDIEIIQKRRMKLSERVRELKRLSKLNEGLILAEDSMISTDTGIAEEGSFVKEKKKIKKKRPKKISTERQIEYSASAINILSDSVRDMEMEEHIEQEENKRVFSAASAEGKTFTYKLRFIVSSHSNSSY